MFLSALAAAFLGLAHVTASAVAISPPQAALLSPNTSVLADAGRQVLVTLGVMSLCPDAHLFESLLARTLADPRADRKVELELVYIGALKDDGRVICKHGPRECEGNVQQLCASAHLDQAAWWPFVTCQNRQPLRIGSNELAEECAREVGSDWEGEVRGCAESEEGRERLRASVMQTQALGVEKSATMLLGKKHKVRFTLQLCACR